MASSSGFMVNAATLAFTTVSGLVVFFRLFSRCLVARKAGLEDVLISLSMALAIGLAVAIAEQVRHGLGWHFGELSEADMIHTLKAFWASVWMYNLSLTTTKVSILVQYLRIFQTRRFRIVCNIVLAFIILHGIWTFFGSIFLCTPVHFFWDKSVKDGKCLNQTVVWFVNAGINIVQDLIILILPMPMIKKLNIPNRQKRALIIVFAMGGFVCIISIVRLHTLVKISNSPDPTFDNSLAALFSAIETNVAIITACLPFFGPILSAFMPSYFPPTTCRHTDTRTHDVEQPKHLRTPSVSTRPHTASSRPHTSGSSQKSHRRTGSNSTDTELADLRSPDFKFTMANAATPTSFTVQQVTVGSGRQAPVAGAPNLPRIPENIAVSAPTDQDSFANRFSRGLWSPPASRTPKTPRTPTAQKPLPITPLPILAP